LKKRCPHKAFKNIKRFTGAKTTEGGGLPVFSTEKEGRPFFEKTMPS
jgi:hypothetical protein